MKRCFAPPHKITYDTESEARAALVGVVIARNRGKMQRREQRVYQCTACQRWHLTSEPFDPKLRGGSNVA